MYINATGHYVPSMRIYNSYFLDVNGLTDEWIVKRTGIKSRSKACGDENHNSMGLAAIDNALASLPYDIKDVDLIVSAAYSVYDTVATLAHLAQRKYDINGARAMYVSAACSSFVNGLEIIETYFAAGKANKALLICSEHNTYYSNETDPKSGHLWGDAAVAYFLSADKVADTDIKISEIYTCGLGNVGKGPEGVILRPKEGGIAMPDGRDVFVNACHEMVEALRHVTEPHGMTPSELNYIITHQANKRIVAQVANQLGLPDDRFINNIEEYGNTGSASCALVFSENKHRFHPGEKVGLTVFGGGYSSGAFLVEI